MQNKEKIKVAARSADRFTLPGDKRPGKAKPMYELILFWDEVAPSTVRSASHTFGKKVK